MRPYHVKEEDKSILDRQMKRLGNLGILKDGPVMQNNKMVTKDKITVTDLRYVNVRIAKNNLAYPLLTETLWLFRSSKCKALHFLDI